MATTKRRSKRNVSRFERLSERLESPVGRATAFIFVTVLIMAVLGFAIAGSLQASQASARASEAAALAAKANKNISSRNQQIILVLQQAFEKEAAESHSHRCRNEYSHQYLIGVVDALATQAGIKVDSPSFPDTPPLHCPRHGKTKIRMADRSGPGGTPPAVTGPSKTGGSTKGGGNPRGRTNTPPEPPSPSPQCSALPVVGVCLPRV